MINFKINPTSTDIIQELQKKIDTRTKPVGSLGKLEKLALQIGRIQNTLSPKLKNPTMLVFAGDHGIAHEPVTPCPQEITWQMVFNFLRGGAGISVFCKQHNFDLKVIDSGVNYDFKEYNDNFINLKMGKETKNFLYEPAMTNKECEEAISRAAKLVREVHANGCNVLGIGEMGIGNTSPATIIMSILCDIPIKNCVGKGAGLTSDGVNLKGKILQQAIENNPIDKTPLSVLATFGGFEVAMMTGAMLQAAELGMVILIDGFIAMASLLVAAKMYPAILDYCIFTHNSEEPGYNLMAKHLNADSILHLNLRLGEGTGAALAYPIIQSALVFLNEMESFESAAVYTNEKRKEHALQ